MAIESRATVRAAAEPVLTPAVENEIPAYRAISPLAVGSLLFGLASFLCFASQGFQFASIMAVVLGALALRKIQRRPDELTGRGLAQLGLALGLACGLSSATFNVVQDFILRSQAEKFLRGELLPILADRDTDGALWYKAPPARRRSMTPEQVRKAMDDPNAPETSYLQTQAAGLLRLIEQLKGAPQATIEFGGIERTGQEELTPYVIALARITWSNAGAAAHDHEEDGSHDHAHPPTSAPSDRADHVAFILKSQRQGRSISWWIDECLYPYVPSSYQPKTKAVDDGHGH